MLRFDVRDGSAHRLAETAGWDGWAGCKLGHTSKYARLAGFITDDFDEHRTPFGVRYNMAYPRRAWATAGQHWPNRRRPGHALRRE